MSYYIASEHSIIKVRVNQVGPKLDGRHQI